jgi:fumarylpyruvate hydrolase
VTSPTVDQTSLAISGRTDRFPVRRIYCVGQNYADHAREMGSDPDREKPFFFMKPADAVVPTGSTLAYPPRTSDLHHEVELVVALGRGGSNVPVEKAEALIFGHAVGIDLTRRDLQAEAKKTGRPWDLSKGFDHSAPIGDLVPGVPPSAGQISLTVDGELRQQGDLADMIWNVAEIIAELSTYVELAAGDLIFTGTPAGVGPVRPGEIVRGDIEYVPAIEIRLAS